MRPSVFNDLALMVSLSNHELVAVRRAHREAMGDIAFQHPPSHAIQAQLALEMLSKGRAAVLLHLERLELSCFSELRAPDLVRSLMLASAEGD